MENLVTHSDIDEMKKQLEEKDKIIAELTRYKTICEDIFGQLENNVFNEGEVDER